MKTNIGYEIEELSGESKIFWNKFLNKVNEENELQKTKQNLIKVNRILNNLGIYF